MTGGLTLVRVIDDLPEGIDALALQAQTEGYGHIGRLVAEWRQGIERFTAEGCVLLASYAPNAAAVPEIAAIGGLTTDIDPVSNALRVRRFYVAPGHRRRGFGRALATALLQQASETDRPLVLHAGDAGAAAFWESMGLQPVEAEHHSHRLPSTGANMRA